MSNGPAAPRGRESTALDYSLLLTGEAPPSRGADSGRGVAKEGAFGRAAARGTAAGHATAKEGAVRGKKLSLKT